MRSGFTCFSACSLRPADPTAGVPSFLRHPISQTSLSRYRNINLLSIDYAFRPCLRFRLTPGGRTFPGNPWDFGGQDSHLSFRYSCPHNHLCEVHGRLPFRFIPSHNAPLPRTTQGGASAASAMYLSPDHFRRKTTRPVSYYALFKWWLPLSQHPGCHRNLTSLITEYIFGALAGDLGCFPFDYGAYPPQSDCRAVWNGIRSLINVSTLKKGHQLFSALPPFRAIPDASPKAISRRTSYH